MAAKHATSATAPVPFTVGGVSVAAGDHICAFYRGRSEREALALPFLSEGLDAGHECICIVAPADRRRFREALAPSSDAHGDEDQPGTGRLWVETPETTYLRTGDFAVEPMLEFWRDWAYRTFEVEGRAYGRGTTDMSWLASEESPVLDDLMSYEAKVTSFTRIYPQVAVCLYDLDLFGGEVIIPVLKAHPKVLFAGRLLENPYHLEPDDILGPADPAVR